MKLLFVNLYPADTIARYLLAAYTLSAYIHSFFQGTMCPEIKVLNFSSEADADKILRVIQEEHSDIFSFSCYIWNTRKIREICWKIREKSDAIIILGGPDISPETIKGSYNSISRNTFFVIGEGEQKITELLKYLESVDKYPKIPLPAGVAVLIDGMLQYRPDKCIIEDLDRIPSVYLDNFIPSRFYSHQQAFLETQRGCRYRCRYCVYHKNNKRISYHSIKRVCRELDFLIIDQNVKAVRIFDPIFTSDLDRAKIIARHILEIKEAGHTLPWIYWEFTYDSVDVDFLSLIRMMKSRERILNSAELPALDRPQHYNDMLDGYNAVNCIGIQSFSSTVLQSAGRPVIDRKQLDRFMESVYQENVVLKIDIILGLPEETTVSFFSGLDYLLDLIRNTDHILNIHRLQILPGTALQKDAKKYSLHYSFEAPYYILSTRCWHEPDMMKAARLSAILFRIINSPLRSRFYTLRDAMQLPLHDLLIKIHEEIIQQDGMINTQLFQSEWIDDIYWNDKIYRDLPSKTVVSLMERLTEDKYIFNGVTDH